MAAGGSQARAQPSRQEDLSCRYLSLQSGDTVLTVRSPSAAIAKDSKVPGGFSSPARQVPLFPARCHPEFSALWLISGAFLASVFRWSLNRDEFRGPEILMKSHF